MYELSQAEVALIYPSVAVSVAMVQEGTSSD